MMRAEHFVGADLGLRSDGTGAVVVRRDWEPVPQPFGYMGRREFRRVAVVVGVYEARPVAGRPLVPSIVIEDIARLALRFRCLRVTADLHYAEAFREGLGRRAIQLIDAPAGASGKLEVWQATRTAILEGAVKIPPLPSLVEQLKQVRSRATSGGGISVEQPRTKSGHGDLASAFALAVHAAMEDPSKGWQAPVRCQVRGLRG